MHYIFKNLKKKREREEKIEKREGGKEGKTGERGSWIKDDNEKYISIGGFLCLYS